MKSQFLSISLFVAACVATSFAVAQDLQMQNDVPPPADDGCCELVDCCCPTSHWSAVFEGTVFQYDRADGSRVGDGIGGSGPAPDEFFEGDYFVSPRISLAYQRCDGLGVRARWFEYDHRTLNPHPPTTSGPPNNAISVDTYTIDFEIFDTFCACHWSFDISAGFR